MDTNQILGQEKQPRLLFAVLAAIGMGLVGCLLFGLLYYLGIIAWISGFVIVVAAGWGYKKFNLKIDVKGYIIIAVIAVVEVIVTLFLSLNIEVYLWLIDQGVQVTFFESFGLVMQVVGANPAGSGVIVDCVLSIILVGLGLLGFYLIERRKQKEEKATQQAEQVAQEMNEIGTCKVVLTSAGSNLLQVISAIRTICGVDLKKAKELAESAPVTLKENVSQEAAEKAVAMLKDSGATAEVQ